MLREIRIENFAIARDLEINFRKGFNVITGESGAGKSLVVEALNFIAGARIKTSRVIEDRPARVQAVFDMPAEGGEFTESLLEAGVIEKDDENLILMRKLYKSGRNNYYVNGTIVSQSYYREVGNALIDIHGQRDSQFLLEPLNQLRVLDFASGKRAAEILLRLKEISKKFREINKEIDEFRSLERERNRRIDWIRYETGEIDKASLSPGEDEELEKQKKILENAETITELARSIYDSLEDENGALDKLNESSAKLMRLADLDPDLAGACENLETALSLVQDVAALVRDTGENLEYDPDKLDDTISRIHLIDTLKQKYGASIEEILEYRESSLLKLKELEGGEEKIEELEKEVEELVREWSGLAGELSKIRRKTAKRFEKNIVRELQGLGMKEARFIIDIQSSEGDLSDRKERETEISPRGYDRVEFMISMNPGTPERSLSLIASGGELSRIMLALKIIFAGYREFSTLALDEIDVGLGGVAAGIMAEKLKEISGSRQVLCVTHLPLMAAAADAHYKIEKIVKDGSTSATLTTISGDDRVEEVVRMIAGEKAPGETRQVAEKMLKGNNGK